MASRQVMVWVASFGCQQLRCIRPAPALYVCIYALSLPPPPPPLLRCANRYVCVGGGGQRRHIKPGALVPVG